jgi:hypothetical protein
MARARAVLGCAVDTFRYVRALLLVCTVLPHLVVFIHVFIH